MWLSTLFGFLLFCASPQEDGTAADPSVLLQGQVQSALSVLASGPDSEAERALYEQALKELKDAAEWRQQAKRDREKAATTKEQRAELETQLAVPETQDPEAAFANLGLAELETLLTGASDQRTQIQTKRNNAAAESQGRANRLAGIPTKILEVRQQTTALIQSQEALSPEDKEGAQGRLLAAKTIALQAKSERLHAEQADLLATQEMEPLQTDWLQRQEIQLDRQIAFLQKNVASKRGLEAEAVAAAASADTQEFASQDTILAKLAQRNEELAAMRVGPNGLPSRIADAERALQESKSSLEQIEEKYRSTLRRMKVAGLTESNGRRLRLDFEWLPSPAQLKAEVKKYRDQYSRSEIQLLEIQDKQSLVQPPVGQESGDYRRLYGEHRELTTLVIEEHEILRKSLITQQEIQRLRKLSATKYRSYIESRILWVKSARGIQNGGLNALGSSLWQWSTCWFQPSTWGRLAKAAQNSMGATTGTALLLLILLAGRRFLARKRDEMNKAVRARRADRMILTIRALVQSLLLTLWLPLVMWYVGTLSTHVGAEIASGLTQAGDEEGALNSRIQLPYEGLGIALRQCAGILWILSFFFHLVQEKSVGEVHFRWRPSTTALVRKQLRWFTPTVVVLALVFLSLNSQHADGNSATSTPLNQSNTVGRLAFCLAMLALAWFIHKIASKDSPLWIKKTQSKSSVLQRFHTIWTGSAILMPLALVGLALLGYYYSSLKLELLLRRSMGLGLALVLIYSLLLRWLNMTRWRLAVAQAREKAKLRAASQAEQASDTPGELTTAIAFDETAVDLPALDSQTRQLFGSSVTLAAILGLYFIWASALPALKGFDNVQLWPTFEILSTEADIGMESSQQFAAIGEASARSEDLPESPSDAESTEGMSVSPPGFPATMPAETASATGLPSSLTLGDVILAGIILSLMAVAARNLPGLLEIALLQRLPLDSGARYAISTLVRYLIFIIGISAASSTLGLRWDSVQWLVAALTFGLAFGLQEIFANFVSGLIILLERPIRVGDVVTVGNVEGTVTRLRMRATTIQDRDRRELLVPNKDFITTSVINWTLTDPITRIIIKIGVAYGSDVELARRLLLEVAKKNSHIVEEPAPCVVFLQFGDSTLDLELRSFISNRDLWAQVVDEVNSEVDIAFRNANIEIAFPQRDLHLRSGFEPLNGQGSTPSDTTPETDDA